MSDIYENTTEIELESLEAIYVNELTYSRNADGQLENIELLLHPATGHDVTKQYVCMTLVFTVSSKYPNEPPEIVIRNPRGLGEEEVASLVEDMILKAEEMKGEPMLYTLIEMAKDSITEGNIPHCPCVVCLEHFHQRDIFHRTACYHYFHSRCLYKYLLHAQVQLEVEEKEALERRHLDAGISDKNKSGKIMCPVCRSALDEQSLMVTCSQEELEEDEKVEEFVMPTDLKEQQRKMLEMYEHQKARGGIIDLEHEKNKYLLNAEDRMPVRSQKLSPITVNDDVPKSATSKQGTGERSRDRPNSSGRQHGSSQQYRKGRNRGWGDFYSVRSYRERPGYEDRPGFRLKTEDGAGRRTNYPPASGSRRMKDTVETDSELKTTVEDRRKTKDTERLWERERRMVDNDRSTRRGHAGSSVHEVHKMEGGFSRTDKRERLDERYDNQRMDEKQKVERRQHNADRYERKGDDVYRDDSNIANKESKNVEAGRMTKADSEYQSVENERGSVSVRVYRTGSGHRREEVSEGRKTYTGGSYRTNQKYHSNPRDKENVYNNGDKSKETEKTNNVSRKHLPKQQTETQLVNNAVQNESQHESNSGRSDRFEDVTQTSNDGRHGQMENSDTERTSSVVRDEDTVAGRDVPGASRVDRPVTGGREFYFRDRADEYAGGGRAEDERIRQDKGSSGYQRGGGGSHRSRGSGAGPKDRGKYQEGRGSYAGYSERSHVRHERPQQQQQHHQQQQQWYRHNRHGEERERTSRNVRVVREKNAEDEMNSATTGQGACGTDITSEASSKDDEEADSCCQIVRPYRQKSNWVLSANEPEGNKTKKAITAGSQDLLDNDSTEDQSNPYGISRFDADKHSHKSSGSEMMGCDNVEDEKDTSRNEKPYPAYSESELRTYYVGFDEVDQENWDEEMDIYYYERYKIRPQRLQEYDRQAAPRKKYYENKIKEKHEWQNMIEAEERRIVKERVQRDFKDDEMELPDKMQSKKDVHMKSILDVFKEEKAKELGTSVCKSNGTQRETVATWAESGDNFESKVDKLYKSTRQNLDSGCMSHTTRACGTPARVDRGIPGTHISNRPDSTNRLDKQKNSNDRSPERLRSREIVETQDEDNQTFNKTGQGQYSKLSVNGNEGSRMTTSCSRWDDECVGSDVCHNKCSLGKVAEIKGVCFQSHGVSVGDCTDSGVFHKGDPMDSGDSHREGSEHWKGDHMYDGISDRGNHRDEVPGWDKRRDKGVLLTGDGRNSGVSHVIGYRRGGDPSSGSHRDNVVSSRDIHRDNVVSSRDIHRDNVVSSRDIHRDNVVSSRDIHRDNVVSSRDIHKDNVVSSRDIHRDNVVSSRDIHRDNVVSSRDIHRDNVVSSRDIHKDNGVSSRDIHRDNVVSSRDIHRDNVVSSRDIHRDNVVSHNGDYRGSSIGRPPYTIEQTSSGPPYTIEQTCSGPPYTIEQTCSGPPYTLEQTCSGPPYTNEQTCSGPPYTNEQTSTSVSFIKHFKKAPPLRFPKKKRQGATHGSPSQIPVVLPAAAVEAAQEDEARTAAHQSLGGCSLRDTYSVSNSQVILTETTSAMLNARPPTSCTDLSSALLDSYMASSVLSGNLLASNQVGGGLNPSLLSLYGTYAGNLNNAYLSDLYGLTCNSAQNVATGNSVTTNTCGVSDVVLGNCVVSGGGVGESARGKENMNNSSLFTE